MLHPRNILRPSAVKELSLKMDSTGILNSATRQYSPEAPHSDDSGVEELTAKTRLLSTNETRQTISPASSTDQSRARGRVRSVSSKIGSLQNASYKPSGGNVRIFSKKLDFSHIKPKIGSLENGVPVNQYRSKSATRIPNKYKMNVPSINDEIDQNSDLAVSRGRTDYETPNGALSQSNSFMSQSSRRSTSSSRFNNIKSKIGSFENYKHTPGGGNIRVQTNKLEWNTESKIGSLKNANYKPKGGDIKIHSENLKWQARSKIGSLKNANYVPKGGDKVIETQKLDWSTAGSKIGSFQNASHKPGGGDKQIETVKLEWKEKPVASKIGSLANVTHTPGGGRVKVFEEKLEWNAQPKIGSLENAKYQPGGGNVVIFNEPVYWESPFSPNGSQEYFAHRTSNQSTPTRQAGMRNSRSTAL